MKPLSPHVSHFDKLSAGYFTPHISRFPLPIALLTLLLLLTACSRVAAPQPIRLAGILENETVEVAPEKGGRLLEVTVGEGDAVQAGQIVARLDDSRLQLQLSLADADIAQAEARLAQLRATVRAVDIAGAAANVAYAESALAAAASALADAQRLRDTPQQADLKVAAAESNQAEATAKAAAARSLAQAADVKAQMWGVIAPELAKGFDVALPGGVSRHIDVPDKVDYANQQWNLASQEAWAAWQQSAAADAAVTQARAAVADEKRLRNAAQTAEDRVVAAANARDEAAARVKQAGAALEAIRAGPTNEQIAAAEAAVAQARAARAALAVQHDQTLLQAPAAGIVTARYRSPGEIIGPGQRLLTISDPTLLTLTVYAPATLLPSLQPGALLPFTVDAAPDHPFQAEVLTIADKPEFALRQSQNVAERADSVYAIKLRVANPTETALLRPGMPADVMLP